MGGQIHLDPDTFEPARSGCRQAGTALLGGLQEAPERTSSSEAMDAFADMLGQLGGLIARYQRIVERDSDALAQIEADFKGADESSAAAAETIGAGAGAPAAAPR